MPDPDRPSSDPIAWRPPTDALFGFDGTGAAPPVSSPFPAPYPPPYPEPVDPQLVGPKPADPRPADPKPVDREPTGPGATGIAGSLYAASDADRDNATYRPGGTYRPGDTYRPGGPRPVATPPAWPPVRRDRAGRRRSGARRVVPFIIAAVFLGRLGIAIASHDFDGNGRPTLAPLIADQSRAVDAMLADQSVALVNGDQAGFLAPVDVSVPELRQQYEMLYENLRALHVSEFSQTAQRILDDSAPPDVYDVAVSYCLGGEFCPQEETAFRLAVQGGPGAFQIEAYAPEASDVTATSPLPWEVSTLHVRTGKRVTLMASDAEASQLAAVLPAADAAAATADGFAVLSTPPDHYDIYLASAAEARTWFGGAAADATSSLVWTDIGEQQAVVVLPDAMRTGPRGGDGLAANVARAVGLLASQQDMFAEEVHADALTAGLGDYVAYLGHPGADADRLAAVAAYVRSGRWPGTCNPAWTASASPATIAADTGIGYLALRRLVQRFGLKHTLAFWGDVERSADPIDSSSQIEFGQPWSAVDADCVSSVHRFVGA